MTITGLLADVIYVAIYYWFLCPLAVLVGFLTAHVYREVFRRKMSLWGYVAMVLVYSFLLLGFYIYMALQ